MITVPNPHLALTFLVTITSLVGSLPRWFHLLVSCNFIQRHFCTIDSFLEDYETPMDDDTEGNAAEFK